MAARTIPHPNLNPAATGLCQQPNTENFTDQQAVAQITLITRGSIRLVDRLINRSNAS